MLVVLFTSRQLHRRRRGVLPPVVDVKSNTESNANTHQGLHEETTTPTQSASSHQLQHFGSLPNGRRYPPPPPIGAPPRGRLHPQRVPASRSASLEPHKPAEEQASREFIHNPTDKHQFGPPKADDVRHEKPLRPTRSTHTASSKCTFPSPRTAA